MKAISVRQAWASLIADETKRYETRGLSCNWKYRGPLLIHAGQHRMKYDERLRLYHETIALEFLDYSYGQLPFGKVLCLVDLVCISPTEKILPIISNQELRLGDFSLGRVALDLRNIRRFKEPWAWKGALGLFNIPDEVVAAHELETL